MVNFLKKYWLFVLLAALAALLSALWYLKPVTEERVLPKLPKITRPTFPGKNLNPNTRVVVNAQPQEQEASLVNIEINLPMTGPDIDRVASSLGFLGEPVVVEDVTDGLIYSWSKDGSSLGVTPKNRELRLSQDLVQNPLPPAGRLPSREEARSKIASLIQSLGLQLPANTQEEYRIIKFEGVVPTTASPEEAVLAEIKFHLSFNGARIVNFDPRMTVVVGWIDREGNIVRFEWKNPLKSTKPGDKYPLKNIDEIKQSLLSGGKVVLIGEGTLEAPRPQSLTSVNISAIELNYFLSGSQAVIEPIFLLTGTAQATGQTFPIWIYLPAVKEEYFTAPEF